VCVCEREREREIHCNLSQTVNTVMTHSLSLWIPHTHVVSKGINSELGMDFLTS